MSRVIGSLLLLLAATAVTGGEQTPTEVRAPAFEATQDALSGWRLWADFGGAFDGGWGEVPCLGPGTWSVVNSHVVVYVREVITPSGKVVDQFKILDLNANAGSHLVSDATDDTWELVSWDAAARRIARARDGSARVREPMQFAYRRADGDVRLFDEQWLTTRDVDHNLVWSRDSTACRTAARLPRAR